VLARLDGTIIRAHQKAAGAAKKGLMREASAAAQALGRSRGDYGTKDHVLADAGGRAVAFVVTPGQAAELPQAEGLLIAGRTPEPLRAPALADAGQARVIGQARVQAVAAEPPDREVDLRLAHQPAVVHDPKQEAGEHKPDRRFGIDAWPSHPGVVRTAPLESQQDGFFSTAPNPLDGEYLGTCPQGPADNGCRAPPSLPAVRPGGRPASLAADGRPLIAPRSSSARWPKLGSG
jgi:hypothetical protein